MSIKKLLIQLDGLKQAHASGLISMGTYIGLQDSLIKLYLSK
jgi:hypothetical protein